MKLDLLQISGLTSGRVIRLSALIGIRTRAVLSSLGRLQRPCIIETMHSYTLPVKLIWAAPIPADRWHCSLWP